MRPGRFRTLLLVVLVLLPSLARPAAAGAATSDPAVGRALTADRRIVSTATPNGYLPTDRPLFGFGFGAELHVPGDACVLYPSELDLDGLTLERTAHGYAATLIFFAPIRPLRALNGNPITHTVSLTFTPPTGAAVVVRLSLTTGKLTVKRGKTDLKLGKHVPVARLDVDRIYFAVPDALGFAPDWDVSAAVQIAAKQPWCAPYPVAQYATSTPPATVGSLTGEDPAGTVTFSPRMAANKMPEAAKIKTLAFQRDADGGLVAVATMRGDVVALAKTDAGQGKSLRVELDLASPGIFGLEYPYQVEWTYFPGGAPEPAARVADPHFGIGRILGEVPVTVAGDTIRFALGKFTPGPNLGPEPVSQLLPVPFGDFSSVFFGVSPASNGVCLCPPGTKTPASDPFLEYDIIGNLIAITHLGTGEVAYGWIDYDGRFLAENATELYRGMIKFFPSKQGYEVGVQAAYARTLAPQPGATSPAAPGAADLAFTVPVRSLVRLDPASDSSGVPYDVIVTLLEHVNDISFVTESDVYDCAHPPATFAGQGGSPDAAAERKRKFDERCSQVIKTIFARPIVTSLSDDSARLQRMLDETRGMTSPSAPFSETTPNIWFSAPATPVATAGAPFPLPFDPRTEFQPRPADADWAIRATSAWVYTDAVGGEVAAIGGPFVDSHLLLTGTGAAATTRVVAPVVAGFAAVVAPVRRPRRRGRARRRGAM